MKKSIFLFFAAILYAMTANAQWYLMGTVTDWSSGKQMTGDSKVVSVTINLKANTNYELKIKNGGSWYGNGGTMSSTNNLAWGFSTSDGSNAKIKTTDAGDYTFTWYISDKKLSVTYPNHNYIVAGDGDVMEDDWSPSSTKNKMEKQDDGTYRLTKTNRSLSVKTYGYKLTVGSWSVNQYPNDNVALKVTTAGNYNVVFTYNPKNGQLSHELVPIYTITTSANPATAGVVTGAGTYAKDASVTLEATPNAGYKFVNWTIGSEVKSTETTYSFTASANVTAVANFELSDPEVPTYAISVSANDDAMGTVTGAGDYTEGSPVTLTATPKTGYRFVNWTVGSEVKSTEATYSFTASEALTIVANFEAIPKYDITVKAVVPETWTNTTIGIHYWGDGISGTSTPVATEKEGNWNKYTIKDVLEGQSVNVIFLNGTSWGSDKSKQTANITGITEDKCFQISAKTLDGEGKCTFTEVDCAADIKPEGDVYTVVGSSDELGLAWDPTKTANDMEKQSDGSYKKVYSNVELTTSVEWKIAKNGAWWNDTPLENKADNGNSVLTISKSGIYNVTFTLSKDLKTAHAEAELLEETNTVADCFVSGNAALTGGTGWAGNEFKMEYDDVTKTYSYTLTGLATDKAYELKVVLGGAWHSYADLASVPTGVTKGNDDAIAFKMAEAGDVTVKYNVEAGITLSGNFALPAPEAKKYYVKGTHNEWTADATSEMTLDGEVYKKEVTLAKDVEFKINDGADAWWGKDNLGGKSYNELEGLESGNLKMKEAKTFTIIFKPAEHLITFEDLTEAAPAEPAKCYLMGNGDWDNGVEMEEDGTQFKLLAHHIYAPFKFKYGEEWSDQVENYDFPGIDWKDGNIVLPEGIYDFYFNKTTKKVRIVEAGYIRNVTNKYGTICLPYASASTSGAYFYKVAGKETGKVYLESVDALEAGVPYIFEATASQITVVYTGDPVAAPVNEDANGLVGTFTNNTEVAVGNYILYNNQFCYAEAICYVNANRAYLVMENINDGAPQQMPGRRYIGMSVQGENETTGFENITNGENTTIKVIENGQLIIIRNGEKFNAQGQKL